MSPVGLLVFYVVLALGVSFVCSVLEAVLLSITPSFVAALEGKDDPLGHKLRAFKNDLDRPLAAILSLNTVAHTVGASGAGAQALEIFGDEYVAVASGVLTLLILIFSEIIPKTLGARYWKRLAPFAARALTPLIWITLPLVWLSQGVTKLMGGGHPHGPRISREEFEILAQVGSKEGIFDEDESRILGNLFKLQATRARDVMTPRIVIFGLDETLSIEDALSNEKTLRFSRIPVYTGTVDHMTGYVLKQEALLKSAQGEAALPLSELRRELMVLPVDIKLHVAMDTMLEGQAHMARLVDEYGGTVGILTMEDLVETLLGMEIVDEMDANVDMQVLARKEWEKRAKKLGLTED